MDELLQKREMLFLYHDSKITMALNGSNLWQEYHKCQIGSSLLEDYTCDQ